MSATRTDQAIDRRDRRRDELIAAAIDCFIKKGFHQTSMRDIAAAAKMSLGNFYNYFNSKQALLSELAQLEAASFEAIAETAAPDADPIAATLALSDALFVEAAKQENAALALELSAEALRDETTAALFDRNQQILTAPLSAQLTRAKATARAQFDDDPTMLAQFLIASIQGLAQQAAFARPRTRKAMRATLATMVRRMLGV